MTRASQPAQNTKIAQQESRLRADMLLLQRGLAASRDRARDLILSGKMLADGTIVTKPAKMLAVDAEVSVIGAVNPWVSRAGLKLAGGLEMFPVITVAGKIALDIGASTGGFTDVLLTHGAQTVIAVDVGRNQLHPRLAAHPRVSVMDGVNARFLTADMLLAMPDLIVCDASFISLKKILPASLMLAPAGAFLIALIKPQFEVGKGRVGKGGIVRDPALHRQVIKDIERFLKQDMGWRHIGTCASPIDGPDGNREFLIAGQKPATAG